MIILSYCCFFTKWLKRRCKSWLKGELDVFVAGLKITLKLSSNDNNNSFCSQSWFEQVSARDGLSLRPVVFTKATWLRAGGPPFTLAQAQVTLNIRSSWSWWKGLLVFISSWRQWKIGSEVNSSANMQPIAHISMKEEKQLFVHIYYISLVIISWYNHNLHIKIFFKVGRWMK